MLKHVHYKYQILKTNTVPGRQGRQNLNKRIEVEKKSEIIGEYSRKKIIH